MNIVLDQENAFHKDIIDKYFEYKIQQQLFVITILLYFRKHPRFPMDIPPLPQQRTTAAAAIHKGIQIENQIDKRIRWQFYGMIHIALYSKMSDFYFSYQNGNIGGNSDSAVSLNGLRKPKIDSWDSMGILGLTTKIWNDTQKRQETFLESTGRILREETSSYIM